MKIVVLGAGTAGLVAALMLREKYPLYPIAVVKSGEIGIVGVGEGSTEHWARFMDYIGISVEEIIFNTRATVKIGILFKDWNLGDEYVHSIHRDPFSKHARMDLFHQLWSRESPSTKFPLSPLFEQVYYTNNVPLRPDFRVSNQFHFDTFKLNEYLLKKCTERNIGIKDAKVTDVNVCSDTGNITDLVTESGKVEADFFIDCSGFKKVLANKLNNKWVSKSEYLPMNHAIAFPTEHISDEIEPYTTTTALSAGWAWRIPTQDRYGNGYVFNDNYINADQALSEISKSLNTNVEKFAKDIKFEAGKVDKFWCKNVVSVGLCGSFAEPLEAQSIGFTVVQMFALLEHLDSWKIYEPTVDNYNNIMDEVFDNVVDYLQLHYFVKRDDTKFWQDKPFTCTQFNSDTREAFKQGINNHSMFKNNRYNMFGPINWYQVMHGIGYIEKESITVKSKNNSYKNKLKEEIDRWAENSLHEAKDMSVMSHKDYLNCVNKTYIKKYGS